MRSLILILLLAVFHPALGQCGYAWSCMDQDSTTWINNHAQYFLSTPSICGNTIVTVSLDYTIGPGTQFRVFREGATLNEILFLNVNNPGSRTLTLALWPGERIMIFGDGLPYTDTLTVRGQPCCGVLYTGAPEVINEPQVQGSGSGYIYETMNGRKIGSVPPSSGIYIRQHHLTGRRKIVYYRK